MGVKKLLPFFALPAILFITQCVSQPPEFSEAQWHEITRSADSEMLYAPNTAADGTFFNPWLKQREHKSGSWFFSKKKKYEKISKTQYGSVKNDYSYLSDNSFDSISYCGHAAVIIKMNGKTIFTDPFLSRAAFIMPKDEYIKFDYSKTPQKPVVLISHNHYDHLDKDSVKKLIKKDAVFIVPLGLKKLLTSYGAKEVHELGWWQSVTLDSVEYTLLPAQHWSRRLGKDQGSRKTLWGGYLIQGSKTVYFSGDTGYFIGFKEFGRFWDIDYAILGAGAYDPRWFMHYSHMNVEEFFSASVDLKAKYAIPMHFGVISLSDEPLLYPLFEIKNALMERPGLGDRVIPLRVGEFIKIQ
ncbi:MAG: MBL fold metallo-hydrolase [Treponema sp.]|nr:MBL fold metallo-hydrolase [Treponema sp.]